MATIRALALALIIYTVPAVALAATLSVSPASGTFEVGDRVVVRVVASSDVPINAVSGTLSFPTSIFSIESVSKSGSILNFWVTEPNFSSGAGTLSFEGVTLGGFPGGNGTVVTATLRATKPGSGSVRFTSGQILANDGQGTDVTDGTTGGTYSVQPATTKPEAPTPTPVAEAPQPAPTLSSPSISLGEKYGEEAVSGTSAYPKADVLLTFVSLSGVKVFITGTTDNQGDFLLVVPQTLRRGTYTVSAVVIQNDSSNSHKSNEITIGVGSLWRDLGWPTELAILLLVVAIIYLIMRTHHHFAGTKSLKDTVHKSFDILREDVGDPAQLKKDLKDAEGVIDKEIKDIEKS